MAGLGAKAAEQKPATHSSLTNDMMRIIQSPGDLHTSLGYNVINCIEMQFEGSQGYINGKDFQIQCLIEYENLKSRYMNKKKKPNHTERGTPCHSRHESKPHVHNSKDGGDSDEEAEDENKTFYTLDKVLNNENYDPKISIIGRFLSK